MLKTYIDVSAGSKSFTKIGHGGDISLERFGLLRSSKIMESNQPDLGRQIKL